jgi:LacI family transcriptional regulator
VPAAELGAQAWQQLRRLLDGDEPGDPLVLAPALTVRGSSGPAPA